MDDNYVWDYKEGRRVPPDWTWTNLRNPPWDSAQATEDRFEAATGDDEVEANESPKRASESPVEDVVEELFV